MKQGLKDSFSNFNSAFQSLEKSIKEDVKTERDVAGVIKLFELTYETCWKAMARLLSELGSPVQSPRTAFETAFKEGLISDESSWLKIIKDRNISVHVYDQNEARELVKRIKDAHVSSFKGFLEVLKDKVKTLG